MQKKEKKYFIIDFDSTFVTVEALDELAKIVLKNAKNRDELVKQISDITKLGMEGKITFSDSLARRVALLPITKKDIEELIVFMRSKITPSVAKNHAFFSDYSDSIYILSGGFQQFIQPIVKEFGIKESHILANSFIFDENGKVTGYDKTNLLSMENGKTMKVKSLGLEGTIIMIGDGYTDYQVKSNGVANIFIAFTENVARDSIIKKANYIVSNFDELLLHLI
jgi:D-3-phosphoglycerate dehydrogenase